MEEQVTHEIILVGGHTDAKKTPHNRVVFGHRVTAKEIFRIDLEPAAEIATQHQDLIRRAMITEFGTLKMPVPLEALLRLDSIDREDLRTGQAEFEQLSLGDREANLLPGNRAKLAFGFVLGEQTYDLIQFGKRITGMDEVQADKQDLSGVQRLCYLIGRQISMIAVACADCKGGGPVATAPGSDKKCSACDGRGFVGTEISGPVELETFDSLDAIDIWILRGAAELWRQTFRLERKAVPENGAQRSITGA